LPNIRVCGKTGTAQLTSEDYAKLHGKGKDLENAWFIGFAPCEAPEIVVVSLFERFPGHGQYAAPIVRDIMKAYFDKKIRLTMLKQEKEKLSAMARIGLPAPGPVQTTPPVQASVQPPSQSQ